ncbi:MAG: hypothetical protein CBB97_22445 [Candidatus Endolissoclinum sp. TMED37]|nr:MAG: hypothetical protein CBB97_22445 [Candidatus Endolissoclinum sp. TMED37]|tara:strand:+ start:217 stop:429 length:213 start_codon:yes stop_codon:yes gene_type:complete
MISKMQRLSRSNSDLRPILHKLMRLARRKGPLTEEEKNSIINNRGLYRTIVLDKNKDTLDKIIDGLLSKK